MNTEERDLITRFIARVGGRAGTAGGAFGSVPSTDVAANPLPPVDPEADALIADLFARYPEARYRVTQMAFVQEHALVEAQNRINRLQWELTQLRQAQDAAAAPPQQGPSPWGQAAQPQQPQQQQYQNPQQPSRGLFGGLFGGSRQPDQPQYQQPQYAAPPPPPQYAPGYQPGMFQQRGSGFLGSALTTAAGVAGGMVAGNALMNMFSGGHGAAQAATNTVSDTAAASPWTATPEPGGQGAWTPVADQSGTADQSGGGGGWTDPTGYDTPAPDSDWSDPGVDDGGWTDPDQS
jgi:hypothetical protein